MSWASRTWFDSVDATMRDGTLRVLGDLRRERGEVFWQILEIISRADPERLLGLGCPPNEYEPEARTIFLRLSEAQSAQNARRIVEEEFRQWFGTAPRLDGTTQVNEGYRIPIPDADLDALADGIWRTWTTRR